MEVVVCWEVVVCLVVVGLGVVVGVDSVVNLMVERADLVALVVCWLAVKDVAGCWVGAESL